MYGNIHFFFVFSQVLPPCCLYSRALQCSARLSYRQRDSALLFQCFVAWAILTLLSCVRGSWFFAPAFVLVFRISSFARLQIVWACAFFCLHFCIGFWICLPAALHYVTTFGGKQTLKCFQNAEWEIFQFLYITKSCQGLESDRSASSFIHNKQYQDTELKHELWIWNVNYRYELCTHRPLTAHRTKASIVWSVGHFGTDMTDTV